MYDNLSCELPNIMPLTFLFILLHLPMAACLQRDRDGPVCVRAEARSASVGT